MVTEKEQQLINFAHYIDTHPMVMLLLSALSIWVLVWKGIALWRAAKNDSKPWYVALLVFNTLGILEIIYIFFFSNNKDKPVA